MSAKSILRQWLAGGETERTIKALYHIAENSGDKYFIDDIIHLSGRFNSLEKERHKGLIGDEYYRIELAKIRDTLLNLLGQVPADALVDTAFLQDEKDQLVATKAGGNPKNNNNSLPKPVPDIPWVIGLILLTGTATAIVVFFPCPTASQEVAFRLLMAIGAAGVATKLPGLFSINFREIKAGSAIGVFVLVYLVNPARLIENDERCNKTPFEFTVSLQPGRNLNFSPQYPRLENAVLQLRLENKWETAEVDAKGDADYKSIPGDFKMRRVAVRLEAKYWKLEKDSVILNSKSAMLAISPDGSLEKIEGKVMDSTTGDPIRGARVEIQGVTVQSDENGHFTVAVPFSKQKTDYVVDITHEGYQPYRGNATPANGAVIRPLLIKR